MPAAFDVLLEHHYRKMRYMSAAVHQSKASFHFHSKIICAFLIEGLVLG